ncbi:chemotaxis protein CheW [Marinobacter xestospongiae]
MTSSRKTGLADPASAIADYLDDLLLTATDAARREEEASAPEPEPERKPEPRPAPPAQPARPAPSSRPRQSAPTRPVESQLKFDRPQPAPRPVAERPLPKPVAMPATVAPQAKTGTEAPAPARQKPAPAPQARSEAKPVTAPPAAKPSAPAPAVKTSTPTAAPPEAKAKSPAPTEDTPTPMPKQATPAEPGGGEPAGRPGWSESPFECLIFRVAGLQLAVPLILLGAIHRLEQGVKPIPGRPPWYMGMLPGKDHNLKVVDSAQWIMAGRVPPDARDNYRFVIRLDNSDWALACDDVAQSFTLNPDEVRWRTSRSKRPWLAGTVKKQMCALIDVGAMAELLARAEREHQLKLD